MTGSAVRRAVSTASFFGALFACRDHRHVYLEVPGESTLRAILQADSRPLTLLLDTTVSINERIRALIQEPESVPRYHSDLGQGPLPDAAVPAVAALLDARGGKSIPSSAIHAVGLRPTHEWPPFATFQAGSAILFLVSPLAITSDSTTAVLYWSFYCGNNCAGGMLGVLHRAPAGHWVLHWSRTLWQH